MRVAKPTRRILEIAQMLGPDYTVKNIDFENVIYREINGYEFEVSGLDHNTKRINATLYVWDVTVGIFTVETISGICSEGELKDVLTRAAEHYSQRPHQIPTLY